MTQRDVCIPADVQITCSASSLSNEDLTRLCDTEIFTAISMNEDGEKISVKEIKFDIRTLAEYMYRYETLEQTENHARVNILHHFRESEESKFTTGEIAEALDINDSTVSRHLGKLTDEEFLDKIQQGVYQLRKD